MTREEGIEMVEKYDPVVPSDLNIFLKKTGMTEKEFYGIIDIHRDPLIWEKKMANGSKQIVSKITQIKLI